MFNIEVQKSEKQKLLEQQGHIFRWQELLDNHEKDTAKPCYCGRQVKSPISLLLNPQY